LKYTCKSEFNKPDLALAFGGERKESAGLWSSRAALSSGKMKKGGREAAFSD
jgi:hypothetical protein